MDKGLERGSSVISREPIGGCHTVQDAMMAENSMIICPCPSDLDNLVRDRTCVRRVVAVEYVMSHRN